MSELQDSEDLTFDDHLAEQTDKDPVGDPDGDLAAPSQDQAVVPVSVVDERGEPT